MASIGGTSVREILVDENTAERGDDEGDAESDPVVLALDLALHCR